MKEYVVQLDSLGMQDVPVVGGKNASLGEMLQHLASSGVKVPGGCATTSEAFHEFISYQGLNERIQKQLEVLDVDDVNALRQAGREIREAIMALPFPKSLETAIDNAYNTLISQYGEQATWAVRSSATAEDMPDASFAGQQETYLNVSGLDGVKQAIRQVFASLFNDRAIAYRVHQGYSHTDIALSAGIQKMVRSDIACSGVMFTLDTESGFRDVVFITGSYGLGEMVVQGAVNPDEFYVHKQTLEGGRPAILRRTLGQKKEKMVYSSQVGKLVQTEKVPLEDQLVFCLSDRDIEQLARMAMTIEAHYGCPMDIEWARDGLDGELYIVQARPETVQSRQGATVEKYALRQTGSRLAEGRAVGSRIGSGKVRLFKSLDAMATFLDGEVLLTDMTDPDWEPIMKKASAIVTNRGGRTCHAAIIARELGIPAVVGCGDATETVGDGTDVTVSCAEGDTGYVYSGILDYDYTRQSLDEMPPAPVKLMMNIGNPDRAFDFAQLPNHGVGLARLEFIINKMIGIHPKALLQFDRMDQETQEKIREKTEAYGDPVDFYVKRLAEAVATIAAAFWPRPVIVRLSDFKSNEYANLLGGKQFEPVEENPMIGFRGASRYISDSFRPCFELECQAMRYVRDEMGLTNIELMIPFVRTLEEARLVTEMLRDSGLERGRNGLRLIMMCELPSNAVIASRFLEYFDGFSIGSNDMTQLTLGLDRDSGLVSRTFDERDPAVLSMLEMAIAACQAEGKYVGICGQGPSDHPDLADWLLERGITSISLNPDTIVDSWIRLSS